jgi:hypothetical protein
MSFELIEPTGELWRTEALGVPVTDLKWRALGKSWLGDAGGQLMLENGDLGERLQAEALYLTIGLSRAWKGRCWPMVVGVHAVPDYEAPVDLSQTL